MANSVKELDIPMRGPEARSRGRPMVGVGYSMAPPAPTISLPQHKEAVPCHPLSSSLTPRQQQTPASSEPWAQCGAAPGDPSNTNGAPSHPTVGLPSKQHTQLIHTHGDTGLCQKQIWRKAETYRQGTAAGGAETSRGGFVSPRLCMSLWGLASMTSSNGESEETFTVS